MGVWIALIIRGGKRERWIAGTGILALFLSDQLSSHFLKPLLSRVRPCHVLSGVHLLVGCPHSYSLPSSHAANCFSIATLFSLEYRKVVLPLMGVALLISYSRIYVGVHYPFDVLSGALLGSICGGFTWMMKNRVLKALDKRKVSEP